MEEVIPEVTEEQAPVMEQPTVEEPPKIAELKFTKPLQPALTPNEERVLEYVKSSSCVNVHIRVNLTNMFF